MPSTLIDIPPDDVFRNDTLGLEPAIQVQSEALLSSSPQAIAIDAGWGSGKTTFMRLWAAYLRKEDVKVVEFNAWKFSLSDPLDALTREILRQFDNIPEEKRGPSHRGLINLIWGSVSLI
ncbi:MAG: P-loop NTPase fold protein [Dehalococcoidia bacterium]|nr:P-loop NTPase fold protein [Dehalococcoidia bacterium]